MRRLFTVLVLFVLYEVVLFVKSWIVKKCNVARLNDIFLVIKISNVKWRKVALLVAAGWLRKSCWKRDLVGKEVYPVKVIRRLII